MIEKKELTVEERKQRRELHNNRTEVIVRTDSYKDNILVKSSYFMKPIELPFLDTSEKEDMWMKDVLYEYNDDGDKKIEVTYYSEGDRCYAYFENGECVQVVSKG